MRKSLSYQELDSLGIYQKIFRYWDWRITIIYFSLGGLFVYYSEPPVASLNDPSVHIVEGAIVKVTSCLPEKRSGLVILEDDNGIRHRARIKNCSRQEREQFIGKTVRAYFHMKEDGQLGRRLEIHFDNKPYHTYEETYGRYKFDSAIFFFGISLVPIALVIGHRWRKEKAAVLAREERDQEGIVDR